MAARQLKNEASPHAYTAYSLFWRIFGGDEVNQEDIVELHAFIENWAKNKNYGRSELLAFLATTFVGTMVMSSFSEEFMDATLSMMKVKFMTHPLRNNLDK